ncbi:uncharacterized protein EV422DRAFT_380939 [Fimicolochytrium jonesii]|uniref:uncharacterized protein n=1 Tax=Fimicolochytrium jonesii TaxID=1396493 RepID=UPI0022FECBFE|nr:uncharacterized protein EV422DRAFT_380939 [Fimicolochytrium jonesii]KAI8822844.1 hypothetical protein EV422DRAFT_380939 [Fimicolochytrium jonesii]
MLVLNFPSFCFSSILLSSVVTMLPGYAVTASVVEILTKNVVAGAARLCNTTVYEAAMAYGLTAGHLLYHAMIGAGFERRPSQASQERICGSQQSITVSNFWLLLCVPVYTSFCAMYT